MSHRSQQYIGPSYLIIEYNARSDKIALDSVSTSGKKNTTPRDVFIGISRGESRWTQYYDELLWSIPNARGTSNYHERVADDIM